MTDTVPLLTTMEDFARELIEAAQHGVHDDGKPPLDTRTAVFKAVTSFLAVKNKLDPPPPEQESAVAQFQRELATTPAAAPNGRARRYRGDPVAKNETLSGG